MGKIFPKSWESGKIEIQCEINSSIKKYHATGRLSQRNTLEIIQTQKQGIILFKNFSSTIHVKK